MTKLFGRIWIIPFILLLFALNVSNVSAEAIVNLYPSKGSVFTEILLEARYLPYGSISYVYWDDKNIASSIPWNIDIHGFDLRFYPPKEFPYSELGNHTVTVRVHWVHETEGFRIDEYKATFEVIEYYPCPEYIALNVTYFELLSNYTKLSDDHNSLVANYTTLNENYTWLSANYNDLLHSYDGLNSNYNNLQTNYESLSSSYKDLIGEVNSVRNLSYIFMATTWTLLATTIYLAVRRLKVKK